MHFVIRATPIDDIDGKGRKMELKNSNQSYKVKTTSLVIYGLRGVHTCRHTFKGISRNQALTGLWSAPGVKIDMYFAQHYSTARFKFDARVHFTRV